jgi:multimeric flavodoxin WrbA
LAGSPRRGGNSEALLAEALAGARERGAETELLRVADYRVAGCIECNCCFTTGRCVVEDQYQAIYEKLLACTVLVVGTPVFFMGVPAQLKAVVDRTQCLWAKKYVLQEPLFADGHTRRGGLLVVGGSKGEKMFESVRLTIHYFFDALATTLTETLFVNRVDERGAVSRQPELLARARELGRRLGEAS